MMHTPPGNQGLPVAEARGHIFVSHSSQDKAVVAALAHEIESAGGRCWVSTRDIPVGANYAKEIMAGMQNAAACVVLLSEAAIASPHVPREVNQAFDLRLPILPVSIDPGIRDGKDLPGDLAYWLSLTQIHQFTNARGTAATVLTALGWTRPAPEDGVASPPVDDAHKASAETEQRGANTARGHGAAMLDDRIRSMLIQVAAARLTFKIALERGRRLGASRDEIALAVNRLRDDHLLDFEGDPEPATTIRLT